LIGITHNQEASKYRIKNITSGKRVTSQIYNKLIKKGMEILDEK